MQEYYLKRVQECEQALIILKQQLQQAVGPQALELRKQIEDTAREMSNYRSALAGQVEAAIS